MKKMKNKNSAEMITIDTRGEQRYSPLIAAVETICRADSGQDLQIIMDNKEAFDELKSYLSEKNVGFREIYDQEYMTLQFTTN